MPITAAAALSAFTRMRCSIDPHGKYWFFSKGCGRSHYGAAAKISYLHLAIYTRLVDPGFLGEPVVIGLAD
jgi:hypothetical protein